MKKDIHLYTAATMNGWKPLIFLEEAELEYEMTHIDFEKKEQKQDWYLKLNPNGRIPTIVDRSNNNFVVFESGAILWYLAKKYQKFIPKDPDLKSETLQWLMFQVGGIGPMMGQAMYFQRIAAPNGKSEEFSTKRYISESRRLLEVLDKRLKGRDYLVGDSYSIADIAVYPWARSFYWANVPVNGLDDLKRWFDLIDQRPLTQKALKLPEAVPEFFGEGKVKKMLSKNASRFKHDV